MKSWVVILGLLCLANLWIGLIKWKQDSVYLVHNPQEQIHSSKIFSDRSCRDCHDDSPVWHKDDFYQKHGHHSLDQNSKCFTCHTQNSCISCHNQRPPSHGQNFLKKHHKSAKNSTRACLTCHQNRVARDCIGCHQTEDTLKWYQELDKPCPY